jgi:ABC-2 type transport system permease protein
MKAESINIIWDYLNPTWIFGPILDKELRVSSRRKRSYLLRSSYVVMLLLYVLTIWFSLSASSRVGSVTYNTSRMAEIGQRVIVNIIWIQFVVSQILAVIMLSSSISDEIRMGTLNVLMTTPINSFQIVTGKLLSKLLQLFLLLALSLPLLAIVRVYGGIPWNYVVSGLAITMAAVVFAGSLSLSLSVFYRQSYQVIIIILTGYLLFVALSNLLIWAIGINIFVSLINPIWAMFYISEHMTASPNGLFSTTLHCMIMLAASVIVLSVSMWRIRYAALGLRPKKSESRKVIKDEKGNEVAHYYEYDGHIRHVVGSPMFWKEKMKGFWGQTRTDRIVTILLICLFCIIAFCFLFTSGNSIVRYSISGLYWAVIIRLAIATAGSIAGEKEARTLPVLLVSPIQDKDIILGKAKGALWRNYPLIILYIFLNILIYFSYLKSGMSITNLFLQIPLLVIQITCAVLFIIGCGSLLGVRTKNASTAIAATIGSYFVLSYLFCGAFNPLRTIIISSFYRGGSVIFTIFTISVLPMIFMGLSGLYLLKLSIRKLRYNIF